MIIGEKDVAEALRALEDLDLRQGITQAISFVQEQAKANCPSHTGELRGSIFTDVEDQNEVVRGICYTNKAYGPFVEFGTGPKGQAHHDGISPEVAVAYTQSPWWIHESDIGRETAEYYHFPHIDTPQGRFYVCSGQAAQPFLYPALKNNEDKIVEIIRKAVKTK